MLDVRHVERDFPHFTEDEVSRRINHLSYNEIESNRRVDFSSKFGEGEGWFLGCNGIEDPFHGLYNGDGESDSLIARFKRNLPVFDGFWHIEDLLTWIDAIDDFFEEVSPPEHVKCKIVSYKMKGCAYYWWKRVLDDRNIHGKEEITSWPRMKNLLLKRFSPAKCSTKCQNQRVEEGIEVVKDLKADKFMPINYSTEFLFESNNEKPKGASDLEILNASEVLCNDIGVETLKKATQIATNESECEGPSSETQHVGHLVIQVASEPEQSLEESTLADALMKGVKLDDPTSEERPQHLHMDQLVVMHTSVAEGSYESEINKRKMSINVVGTPILSNNDARDLRRVEIQRSLVVTTVLARPMPLRDQINLPQLHRVDGPNLYALLGADYDKMMLIMTWGEKLKIFKILVPDFNYEIGFKKGEVLIVNFDPGGRLRIELNAGVGKRQFVMVNMGVHLAEEGKFLASDADATGYYTNANVILMPKAPPLSSNDDLPEFIFAVQPLNLGHFVIVILSFDPGGITYSSETWNSPKSAVNSAKKEAMSLDDNKLLTMIDLSGYIQQHTVTHIIGDPPWSISHERGEQRGDPPWSSSHEKGEQRTQVVMRQPYSVVLAGKLENIPSILFNVLLFVMNGSSLTDGIVVWTSSLRPEYPLSKLVSKVTKEFARKFVIQEARKHFKPGFLNRFDRLRTNPFQLHDVATCLIGRDTALTFIELVLGVAPAQIYDYVYRARPNMDIVLGNLVKVSKWESQMLLIIYYTLLKHICVETSLLEAISVYSGMIESLGLSFVFREGSKQDHVLKRVPKEIIWSIASHCNFFGDLLVALSLSLPCGIHSQVRYTDLLILLKWRKTNSCISRYQTDTSVTLTRGRVIPREGWNDTNKANRETKFIMGEMNVAIIDPCGNSLYKSG